MSCDARKTKFLFLTGLIRAEQHSQKKTRDFKFRIEEEEGMYHLRSENKGAEQLRADREAVRSASLFSHMQNIDFPIDCLHGSYVHIQDFFSFCPTMDFVEIHKQN